MPERAWAIPNRHEFVAIAALVTAMGLIICAFSSRVAASTKVAVAIAAAYPFTGAAPFAIFTAWVAMAVGWSPFAAIIIFVIAGHVAYDVAH